MTIIALILFYLFFPVLAVYLARKNTICNKLGAVVICYICGIVIGNIGVLPANLADAGCHQPGSAADVFFH